MFQAQQVVLGTAGLIANGNVLASHATIKGIYSALTAYGINTTSNFSVATIKSAIRVVAGEDAGNIADEEILKNLSANKVVSAIVNAINNN